MIKMNKIREENITLTNNNTAYGIAVMVKSRFTTTLETPHMEAPTRDSIKPIDLSLIRMVVLVS